jgi:hypothetical protein
VTEVVERVALDQREVQRMGGRRAKHPAAAVVEMLLRPLKPGCVLETTYGEGRFYLVFRPPYLVGVDVERREWRVRPDEFYEMPVWSFHRALREGRVRLGRRPEVVVCDPPWGHPQRRAHYARGEAWGTPRLIVDYSVRVAELLGAGWLLLHYREAPELPGFEAAKVVEFRPFTRYLNAERTVTYFALYRRRG